MVLENSGRPVTARMKGERFTRWVASASNEQALVAMQQFYGDASKIKAQAPAGRRVLSAGSRFSLSGTSCTSSGALTPGRACPSHRDRSRLGTGSRASNKLATGSRRKLHKK